jgi:ATP-dependent exoDNAse (exonuclease V) beta subunit
MNPIEIISASAGTGKTTKLAKIIYEAVSKGTARPEAILATTFTNRAAAELAERARAVLLEQGQGTAAHRIHAARIGTVNSVCGGLVHDFAFLQGLSPRVSLLDERRAQEEPLRAGLQALPQELLDDLEDLHTRMGSPGPSFMGITGPGEWDWQQDAMRIVDLARSNVIDPERFAEFADRSRTALLEFLQPPTQTAADLDRALEAALASFIDNVDTSIDTTGVTQKALTRARGARSRGARKLGWAEWASLAQLAPGKKSSALAAVVREAAAAHDEHPRLRDDLGRAVNAVFAAAGFVLDAYQAHKRSLGVIDFVDQETEALKLLKNDAVRQQLAEEIDLVLVDEFQDTSPIQLAIFLELARIAGRSTWVGDPKQAIYGFRGADPALMDAAIATLLGDDPPETLAKSYRSRPGLVRLTSDLFAPAFAETGIREELVRVEPAEKVEPDGLGPILERWVLEPGTHPKTGKAQKNAKLDLISLANGVSSLLADPDARVRDRASGDARSIQPSDIAVLCFRNNQCTGLARELEARGIRAVVGRPGLIGTLEARLALASLRLWIDPRDLLARAELARWLGEDDGDTWLETVLAARADDELFADLDAVAKLRKARGPGTHAGVLASFDAALAAVGVRELAVGFGDATARLANLDALRSLAAAYVELCRNEGTACSLRGLLVHLEKLAGELLDSQAAAERPDAVRICTLHGSKGLEWNVTVLADLSDPPEPSALGVRMVSETSLIDLEEPLSGRWLRYWPSPYGKNRKGVEFLDRLDADDASQAARDAARREALRLVYVGWTRARDRLVLAGRPGKLGDEGGLRVLAKDGAALLSEPDDQGKAQWGVAGKTQEVEILVRSLPPLPAPDQQPRPAQGYAPSGPQQYPPATLSPSELEGTAAVGEPIQIGERISISIDDEDEMRRFGDAVHSFFAVDRQARPQSERDELAREILARFGVPDSVDAAALCGASDRLAEWIESQWPGATWHREWPLIQRLANGTVLRGVADLVLESDSGLVLLDHKSFPGNREQATERAAKYAGQLAAYAGALEAATGKSVLGAYIHLPVSGLMVEVGLPG